MSDKRTEELALLYEAAGLLGRTLDPAVIYSTLQAMVARVMDCASLLISIYTPEDGLIRCVYACTDGVVLDTAAFPPLPLDQEGRGMQSRVIRSGLPLMVEDALAAEATQSTRFYAHADGTVSASADPSKPRVRSLVIVPIQLEGKVLGTAQVMSYRLSAYTEDHLRLLEALLIQVAAATRSAYLFQKMSAELAERSRVEAENLRLLAEAEENVKRQRAFLRDVLASVTDGRLQLCDTPADLPPALSECSGLVPLTQTSGLSQLRHEAQAAAEAVKLSEERGFDLVLAVGEAGMNAVVHRRPGNRPGLLGPSQPACPGACGRSGRRHCRGKPAPRDAEARVQHESDPGAWHEDDPANRRLPLAFDGSHRTTVVLEQGLQPVEEDVTGWL